MKLIITFSGRSEGNCAAIAGHIGGDVVRFADLHAHGCADCAYECFHGECPHRADGVYDLYSCMTQYDQVILVVPMYGGNPSSLYFAFCERGQDFFRSEESWKDVLRRLYIIGVYGSAEESPDFIPTLEKWFTGTEYTGRVLGLERHVYGQTMTDSLLDAGEVRDKINEFLQ